MLKYSMTRQYITNFALAYKNFAQNNSKIGTELPNIVQMCTKSGKLALFPLKD